MKLGVHKDTQERVAIKIISKTVFASQQKEAGKPAEHPMKKLEREVAIMKIIQHNHILALFDVFETKDDLYVRPPPGKEMDHMTTS